LEGLSVSYYIRPARNYDTLLQMGRWFGYRPGYLDLCRLYTTNELVEWYQHISMATEELKREFRLMELNKLTPEDYGLKVRTHPAGLSITAANKIRSGQSLQVSFSGQLSQTTVFHKDELLQQRNFTLLDSWVLGLGEPQRLKENSVSLVWEHLPADTVIDFLSGFETHPLSRKADAELLVKYIRKLNLSNRLKDWTVMLVSSNRGLKDSPLRTHTIGGHTIGLTKRADSLQGNDDDKFFLKNSNILSPSDQLIDLTEAQQREALENTRAAWRKGEIRTRNHEEPKTASGPFIRKVRPKENALLLIYPLDPHYISGSHGPVFQVPIIGFAVSFPDSGSSNDAVEYKVNAKYWEDRYGVEDEDDTDV
jgi:hypothetical protein